MDAGANAGSNSPSMSNSTSNSTKKSADSEGLSDEAPVQIESDGGFGESA